MSIQDMLCFLGSGKSTIFNKLSQATTKREEYEEQRKKQKLSEHSSIHSIDDNKKSKKKSLKAENDQWSRHMITNDVSYC